MSQKRPDVWITLTKRPYPSGADVVYQWGLRAMAWPTMIDGRIRRGTMTPIERALSDWKGNVEASPFSFAADDSDGIIRALIEELGADAFAMPELSVQLLSEEGRKSGLTPRVIHRGVVAQSPVPLPRRGAQVSSVDAIGARFYAMDPEAPIQRVFITREHLEGAGILGTPAATIGKPYNIILGEHSDIGAVDVNGVSAVKGLIPPDYLGKLIITSEGQAPPGTSVTVVPPPVLVTAEVVGAGGSAVYTYAITAFVGGGETLASNVMTVTGAPNNPDAANYVRLVWAPPAGYESLYESVVIGYRICGRNSPTPNRHLDLGRHALLGDGLPDWTPGGIGTEYHDDHDHDIEKEPGPPETNTARIVTSVPGGPTTFAKEYGVFAVGLGAIETHYICGSDVASGDEPRRAVLDANHPEILSPLSAAWPFPDPFLEVNGVRLTVFFATGGLLQHHLEGIVTFAVGCCGVEDVGDGSGVPITEMGPGLQWLFNEICLKDGGVGYRNGSWGPLEEYADGTPILKTSAFAAAQATSVGFIGGRGYQIHLALTQVATVREVWQWALTTFNLYEGPTEHGQIAIHIIDDLADVSTAAEYRQHIEIDGDLPSPTIADDQVENRIPFRFDWDPDANDYRGDLEILKDDPSIDKYGLRPAADDFLGLRCTRDAATARDAMARRLLHNKVAPLYQPVPTSMIGMEQANGALFRLTHLDGPGVNGYVDRPFFTVRHLVDPNPPLARVQFVGRDLYRVLTLGFPLGLMDEEGYDVPELGDETLVEAPPAGPWELR